VGRFLLKAWRKINPEIALGFVLATVFWILILGWQAAYAPTEIEKQKCQEAARTSGHKAEECKTLWERTTSDPVAFFTFWLVVSTIGLGVSTVMLWRAGEKQLKHGRRSAAIQSRDMRASIEASHRAAKAAENSVLTSRQVGESQVRAYLSCEGGTYTLFDSWLTVEVRIRNHGQSPAIWTEIKAQVVTQTIPGLRYERSEPFTNAGPAVPAGREGTIILVFLAGQMGEDALESISREIGRFDVRGVISWRDVFEEIHRQDFVLEIKPDAPSSKGKRTGEMVSYNHADR
jgi:hypothetical protein